MTITKYEHACFVIEDQGKKLVIDPGAFSSSFKSTGDIAGVVITHHHMDHIDEQKVRQIRADSPDALVISTQQTKDAYPDLDVCAMVAGEGMKCGPFQLEFCGGKHAVIHESRPQDENIGVMVNDAFYYPGDSFAKSPHNVKVLAAPAAAPWMKIGEGIDYLRQSEAEIVIPTHDAVLSDQGRQVHDSMLQGAAEAAGMTYRRLQPGESVDI